MADRPQLIVPLEHAERAIAHCARTGTDVNFMAWSNPLISRSLMGVSEGRANDET